MTAPLPCICGHAIALIEIPLPKNLAESPGQRTKGWPKHCPQCAVEILAPLPGPQTLALASTADVVLMGGGVFGGKSFAAVMITLMMSTVPGFTALILRLERTMLKGGGALYDKFRGIFGKDPRAHFRESAEHFDIRLMLGRGRHRTILATIAFGGFLREENFKRYEGNEYALIVVDEVHQFSRSKILKLFQRNRGADGYKGPSKMFLTCNPPEPDDEGAWIVTDLVEWYLDEDGYPIPERSGVLRYFTVDNDEITWKSPDWTDEDGLPPKSFTFIPALVKDNPVGIAANPSYLSSIRAQTKKEQKRKRDGCWYVDEGSLAFGDSRILFIDADQVPPVLTGREIRYWDQGLGQRKDRKNKSDGKRNGSAGVRGGFALCPHCDGDRFVDHDTAEVTRQALELDSVDLTAFEGGPVPCLFCNIVPDTLGGYQPWVGPSDVNLGREALWLTHIVWEQGTVGHIERLHQRVAQFDGPAIPIYIEEETGKSGKANTYNYAEKVLPGYEVTADRPTGQKIVRAKPLIALGDAGLIFVVRDITSQAMTHTAFTSFTPSGAGKYKDIIDGASGLLGAANEHEWPTPVIWSV